MDRYPLITPRIAVKNLKSKPFRTINLILLVAILAFALFGGTMLAKSLQNGMESLSQRLGADILVVPYGYETDMEGTLLRGEPSTFYFDARTVDKIADMEGVARTSPQLYIATLRAGCCSYPVQLIGYDPGTDFIIQPWLSGMMAGPLADGEIVVGSSINAGPKSYIL